MAHKTKKMPPGMMDKKEMPMKKKDMGKAMKTTKKGGY